MTTPPIYNIGKYDLYNIFINFITDNVSDIRSTRKNERWVFDEFPTSNDNYPECVVEIPSSTPIDSSTTHFLYQEKTGVNVTKEVYYALEEASIKVRVLSLKDSKYSVTIDGATKYLKKKSVNLYLAQKIKEIFVFKYVDLINNNLYNDDIKIIEKVRVSSTDRVYESNEMVWASDIVVNVQFKNVYIKEYSGTGELIQTYSLVLNLEN